jgi:aspartate racemase
MQGETERVIGVIGGLGPEATHDFFGKLLAHSNAKTDQEHLHIIIEDNPKTPNRNDAIAGNGPSPGPHLAAMGLALERAGADFIVMACNTAHAFEADIRAAIKTPFVSLIGEVVDEVTRHFPDAVKVGLLAAQGCVDSRIYHEAFAQRGIEVLTLAPEPQARFMSLLYRIKSGGRGADISAGMKTLADELAALGADILLAGCTEVPLVLGAGDSAMPFVDSTEVLAKRCVLYARRQAPLPS